MGEADLARVDVAALFGIAGQYESAAEILDAVVRTHLSRPAFGGSTAGRLHAAHGDALRAAVDDVVDELRQWSRAATEIAYALRNSAQRYADADSRAARRVG
jgi:uncharacterized protein YukE